MKAETWDLFKNELASFSITVATIHWLVTSEHYAHWFYIISNRWCSLKFHITDLEITTVQIADILFDPDVTYFKK